MILQKTFRFRLEPTGEQRQLFARFAGCCRFVFNQALTDRKTTYEQDGKTLSFADQCKALTELKKAEATAWLGEVHSRVLQQALKDLDAAYQHFFRRVKKGETPGFPRFKKKGVKDSFRYPQGIKLQSGKVNLPKIGWVRYRDSRPVEGKILQATVKRDGGHWFVCLACEAEKPDPDHPATSVIGVDKGLPASPPTRTARGLKASAAFASTRSVLPVPSGSLLGSARDPRTSARSRRRLLGFIPASPTPGRISSTRSRRRSARTTR